jgi:CheY-like chemotaxis protein
MEANRRILIVDDQSDLREQLAQLLLNSGRPNKTAMLVRGMRARLMGVGESAEADTDTLPLYDIDTAGQGEEAYDMAKAALANKAPYAVMFVDMRMPPGWDGLKTARMIREIDPNLEIVIMTAYADHSQEDLSREIGNPEKLLYIKKPFQSEEICQLALSLCAKWNLQMLHQKRRSILERLVLSIRKIKQQETLRDTYRQILDAYLEFFQTECGFIAAWNPESQSWNVQAANRYEEKKAMEFLTRHQPQLLETTALSEVETLQAVPLRERGCNAILFADNGITSDDPIWFQAFNALNQTALDQIEFGRKLSIRLRNCPSLAQLDDCRQAIDGLKKKYLGDPDIARLSARLNDISY